MQAMVLRGVVVQRSGDELTLVGRVRIGVVAVGAVLSVGTFMLAAPAAVSFRFLVAAVIVLGAVTVAARSRTRLVLHASSFLLSGFDGLRLYKLKGPLAALEIVGTVPMMPQFENVPYKDPDYFLQVLIEGRIVRAFRGLPRPELDEITAQIRRWKANNAG